MGSVSQEDAAGQREDRVCSPLSGDLECTLNIRTISYLEVLKLHFQRPSCELRRSQRFFIARDRRSSKNSDPGKLGNDFFQEL